jgi:hypothetical protein
MTNGAEAMQTPKHEALDDPRIPEDSLRSIAFTAVLLVVGLVFLLQSSAIGTQAAIWPRGLAILLVALTALRLGILIWKRRRNPIVPAGGLGVARLEGGTRRRIFTACWLVAYCLVARLVGFGPALLVFIPVYMWVCDFRRPLWIAAITVGSAIVITLLFDVVASVPVWDARL